MRPENGAAPRPENQGADTETYGAVGTDRTIALRQPAGSLSKLGSGVFKARDLGAESRSRRQPVILPLCRAVSAAAPYLPPEVLAELEQAVGRAVAGLLGVEVEGVEL